MSEELSGSHAAAMPQQAFAYGLLCMCMQAYKLTAPRLFALLKERNAIESQILALNLIPRQRAILQACAICATGSQS